MTDKNSSKKNKKHSKSKEEKSYKKQMQKFEEEIIKLRDEVKEKNDKLLRSYAELQNYQKRIQKDIANRQKEIKTRYISELIDLKEILTKAYEDENPKEGLKLILKNINDFLEREDIKCIECIGDKFDHNLHHAVTTVEKKDCDDGEIIEEIKKGFMIDDEVVRPSHVIVVKNNENKDKK